MPEYVRKILLVDDHKMIVDGLKLLLSNRAYCLLSAYEVEDGIALAKAEKPELAIVDYRIGDQTGDYLVHEIRYHSPATRILGYSYSCDENSFLQMADAGLHGFVLKSAQDEEVLYAVDALLRGEMYFDEVSRGYLTRRLQTHNSKTEGLTIGNVHFTEKEVDIIRLISKELSAKEISERVYLSERTVEQYKSRIGRKVGAKNMVGILKYAIKFGIIKPNDL